ncbi:MarR family winged helix-turn-helix transcriptional regulator [Kitasatospora sp. NPDC054939]
MTHGTSSGSVLALSTYLLSRTGSATRSRLTDHLAGHGLRLWHVTVLAALDDHGPHSKGELAARLDIAAADVGRTVDELARAGQVDCRRPASDRRRIEVTLTPAGTATLATLNAELSAMEDALLAPLTAHERTQFAGLLGRLFPHICRRSA